MEESRSDFFLRLSSLSVADEAGEEAVGRVVVEAGSGGLEKGFEAAVGWRILGAARFHLPILPKEMTGETEEGTEESGEALLTFAVPPPHQGRVLAVFSSHDTLSDAASRLAFPPHIAGPQDLLSRKISGEGIGKLMTDLVADASLADPALGVSHLAIDSSLLIPWQVENAEAWLSAQRSIWTRRIIQLSDGPEQIDAALQQVFLPDSPGLFYLIQRLNPETNGWNAAMTDVKGEPMLLVFCALDFALRLMPNEDEFRVIGVAPKDVALQAKRGFVVGIIHQLNVDGSANMVSLTQERATELKI